ncbi:MAG TPA: hypothetical protein VKC34_01835 [Blastocatellia bacterium]|nr:hypothetical protein [Blastocatellia bacterium]
MAVIKLWKSTLAVYLCAAVVSCAARPGLATDAGNANAGAPASGAEQAARQPAQGARGSGREPSAPATLLDTTYERPTGRKINVQGGAAGGRNLQAALDQAAPGDTILLEAGATFTGNFVLPKKAGGAGWVTVRSSAGDSELPPPGTRVTPAQAPRMPKVETPNADPVLKTAPGAHHFRFIGVEFTQAATASLTYDLIQLGSGSQTSIADVPHDLTIDRCYIHGNSTTNLRRGVALNSARSSVIDSHISDCHEQGADSQAVCGWNGPGPFKVVNNYLEGAGENVMFGGADPKIADLVPSDIEFRRNHCFKPLAWKKGHPSYAGRGWSVKNVFELKNARRVLVDGNLFENNWVDAQNGFAILFTVRNQEGSAPWSVVEDVTFTNNVLRHTAAAINVLGRDNNNQSEQVKRVKIHNNLVYDVGGKQWGGNGVFLQISETRDVSVDHNTVMQRGNIVTGHGSANEGFVFTNNLVPHNEYGVIGDGTGPGNATLSKYFPGITFKKNAIAGGQSSLYPPDNLFPAAPDDAAGNFNPATASPFKKAGTDGRDIGCDLAALEAAAGSLQVLGSSLTTRPRIHEGRSLLRRYA